MKSYFTVRQVTELLQLHWQTILKYIRQRKLKAAKFGREYRISPEDLDEFIQQAKERK